MFYIIIGLVIILISVIGFIFLIKLILPGSKLKLSESIEKGLINAAPSDTAEIYKSNVIDALRTLHQTPRTHLI